MNANHSLKWHMTGCRMPIKFSLSNAGVICPACGVTHQIGDIDISGMYDMPHDTFERFKDHIIQSKLEAILPIVIDQHHRILCTSIKCYVCGHDMYIVPHHLCRPMEAFHRFGMFTYGTYYTSDSSPSKRVIKRKLHFIDINYLLTALIDRVYFENIEFNPVPGCQSIHGVPAIWEFDVSATKDQDFEVLDGLQLVKNEDGFTGYLRIAPDKDIPYGWQRTERFMNALGILLDFVQDWVIDNNGEFDFSKITSDPFRDYYRKKHREFYSQKPTMEKALELLGAEKPWYPPMFVE